MEDLFRQFWWLMFPLLFIIGGGFNAWMAGLNRRRELEVIRAYVEQGKDVPPELLK